MEQNINEQVRTAIEQMEYPFDEAAWEKMELLLNREDEENGAVIIPAANNDNFDKIRSNHRKMLFTLIILLLMILFLPFWDKIQSDNISATEQKPSETKDYLSENKITNLPITEKVQSGLKKPAEDIEVAEDKNFVAEKLTSSQQSTLVTVGNHNMQIQIINKASNVRFRQYTYHGISKMNTDSNGIKASKIRNEQSDNTGNRNLPDTSVVHSLKTMSHTNVCDIYEEYFNVKQSAEISTMPFLDKSLNENIAYPSVKKQVNKETDSIQKNLFKNIGFTIFTGTEVNSVKMKNWGAVQPLAGAGITVYSGKHLSYSGLIVFSKKTYTTNRKGYNPPEGSALQPIDTLNVNADCNVLEIPVAIRYYINGNQKNGLFMSAGLSSYLMRREDYFFQYYEQGIYKERQRLVIKENNHFISNLNLSIGYQYSLTKKLRFFAEPYLKLPLSGVGAGTVKLTSAGIAAGITFLPW